VAIIGPPFAKSKSPPGAASSPAVCAGPRRGPWKRPIPQLFAASRSRSEATPWATTWKPSSPPSRSAPSTHWRVHGSLQRFRTVLRLSLTKSGVATSRSRTGDAEARTSSKPTRMPAERVFTTPEASRPIGASS
jgi:hypothetical protein